MPDQTHTILIVDDEPAISANIAEYLERKGFNTKIAADGLQALEVLNDDPAIAVIVTDLRMPRLDGLGLLARLKQMRPQNLPRIIVVSGHGNDEDVAAVIAQGAYEFLNKPLNMKQLMALLDDEATARNEH